MTNRRDFLSLAAAAALPAQQPRRPNIVLIVADDLGFADLGFQGSSGIRTPHLDRLAGSGVRFTNGYVSHPFCSPSRAGMLTGRYQHRFGHENNMVVRPDDPETGLPVSETMLPAELQKAGYATGFVGKWHLGAHPRFHPKRRGFQEMYGFLGGGHDYFHPGVPGDKDQHFYPIERDGAVVPEKEYLTTALGREADKYVRRHAHHPFFLYFAFNAPHSPLQAPQPYLRRYPGIADPDRRSYAAMVSAMDDAVGRVLDTLRDTGIERDTLVFFLSDNGGPKDNASSNLPLRAGKRTLYEGGIRVPFVVRWPGALPSGKTFDHPAIALDIFSTSLAAAGAASSNREIDGVNLLPHLQGHTASPPHGRLFWRTFGGYGAAVREGPLKWVREGENAPGELYDLDKDPGENTNLAASRPLDAQRLGAAWRDWSGRMAKPLWLDHIFDRERLGNPTP